jgi:two-component system OmpR family response regulator
LRLLIVEDDRVLGERVKLELERAGFAVDTAGNGIDGEHLGTEEPYDAVVLDLGLPKRSGLEVLRNWRRDGNPVPVLVLTARDAWYERVDGFKAGADDYLGKPFHVEELVARLQALIRRRSAQVGGIALSTTRFSLDEERQVALTGGGRTIELTGTEFRLLRYMMLHPDKILSKSRLTEHVYEYDAEKDSNVIEVYVNRLRHKLGKDLIETRRGQGYVFRDKG